MQKLLKRWYVWLGLVLLLGLAGSVALICSSRGRITQENFDLIQDGMTEEEVTAVLGKANKNLMRIGGRAELDSGGAGLLEWRNGPSVIDVVFARGVVRGKESHFAGVWETLQWHAKKGAAKIGVKWD